MCSTRRANPADEGGHRAGTGWWTASRWRRASPPTWPGSPCSGGVHGAHPTRYRRLTRRRRQGGVAGTAAHAARGADAHRTAPSWCWSVTFDPERILDTTQAALSTWDGGGRAVELPPIPGLTPGPLTLVDRPGSVQSSIRLALPRGRAEPHPDHAPLATGQPHLRRILLVPLGGEHPRGQGIHLRSALLGRALDRRQPADRLHRGGHRGDRAGAAGDVVRVGSPGQPPAEGPRSWSRPGNMRWAPCNWACPRRPVWPGWRAPTRATGCAWTTSSTTPPGWPAATVDQVAAAAATYLAPTRAVSVVLGDADVVERSLAALSEVRREALPTAATGERGA